MSTVHKTHAYDEQKDIKADARLQLLIQKDKIKTIYGPITLDITFFMQIPESYSEKRKNALVGTLHSKRPDLSNLIKYVEDVAQGILFFDDSCITNIIATKIYDRTARTEFMIIKEIDEKDPDSDEKKKD